ncbi:hypothetical protein D9611_006330 [Ephemerocybe angulata]|uniref:Peptidase M20 dimerisation domain-containing protein n=1 Tax=Ephemerocybe angulata TaxID=980116 RepID=A0A8H5FH02_9AGAR|nr:hypothetical protein D9611_006330 [Tulosesus angulatus]
MENTEEAKAFLPSPVGAITDEQSRPKCKARKFLQRVTLSVLLALVAYNSVHIWRPIQQSTESAYGITSMSSGCPQVDALRPSKHQEVWSEVTKEIHTEDFRNQAVQWLSGAVQIPTESFDQMGPVGQDPRWDAFAPFHAYLESSFPLIHTTLKRTEVNTYGLIYEWVAAEDNFLKPILLAAHQDVVPVAPTTVDQWTHPPYSGHYDGQRVWGRGSNDDKSGLIGILTAVETLLKSGFKPTRNLVLAFGFDEETSGLQGAGELYKVLEQKYGKDGIAMVVDEGMGYSEQYGTYIAGPGIGEKGSLNVQVEVKTPGGHSSVPPAHTSIGVLSALLVHFEQNPFEVTLTRDQPIYSTFQCIAEHAKDVPKDLRKIIKKSAKSDCALKKLGSIVLEDNLIKSLVGSTQAIDMIQGGVKSNALPEQAWAVVNHRISVTSSVAELKARDTKLLEPIAHKFNLSYNAFGDQLTEEGASSRGSLVISDISRGGLEPAPVTPTSGDESVAYRVLSGTIKAAFNAYRGVEGDASDIVVAPSMMSGNTDTRFYWNLTRHIFRYSHQNGGKNDNPLSQGIHTVNERIEVDAWLEMIQFYTTLILNADESTDL